MQESMKNQLRDLSFQRQSVLPSLDLRRLNRHRDVTKIRTAISRRKRKNVRGLIDAAKGAIEFTALSIRNKRDRCRRASTPNLIQNVLGEFGPVVRGDFTRSLSVNNFHHRHLYLTSLGVLFVGFDDHLHELVTHDILFGEVDEFDTLEIRKDAFGFYQSTALTLRQIHLRDVTGDHRF